MSNNFNGFALFNDVEDTTLRNRNRGVVMANIVDAYAKDGKVSQKGAYLLLSYFSHIPDGDKKEVYESFERKLLEYGYERT